MKPTRLIAQLVLVAAISAMAFPAYAEDNTNKFTTTTDQSFTGGKLVSKPGKGGLSDIITSQRARNRGVIAASRIAFSAAPANLDTVTIGGHEFRFLTTLIAATTYTQVKRGANAAATLATLLNAVNGVSDANVVPATTIFAKTVFADAPSATVFRIQFASKVGGTPVPGPSGSITLACTITAGASAWPALNLNATGGKALADQDVSDGIVAITAAMVTNGFMDIELPFTPTQVLWDGYSSTFVKRAVNEAVTIASSHLHLTLAGGGSPNWQAGDFFVFHAVK